MADSRGADARPDLVTDDPEAVRLERLAPRPGARHARKRIGRGIGSGHGKTSGRGQKGLGARSGGTVPAGYQGGQMPVYMQQGKLRGSNRKMSMPMGPFRTHTVPVNVGRLSAFEVGTVVDPEALAARGLVKNNANRNWPIKILAKGEIDHPLTVRAHQFSAAAKAKIEAAGGTVELLSELDRSTTSPHGDSSDDRGRQSSAALPDDHGSQPSTSPADDHGTESAE